MKSFLLVLIALITFIIVTPFGILWQCILHLRQIPEYFYNIAIIIDQAGNVICRTLFNDVLIKNPGYPFGNPDETISSCLGKNKERGTLKPLGKALAGLLDKIEKNHVEKAIDLTETN